MRFLLWTLSFAAFLSSIFFGMWAMQAAWLTSFADTVMAHEYSVRFGVRLSMAVLSLIVSIFLLHRSSKIERQRREDEEI